MYYQTFTQYQRWMLDDRRRKTTNIGRKQNVDNAFRASSNVS